MHKAFSCRSNTPLRSEPIFLVPGQLRQCRAIQPQVVRRLHEGVHMERHMYQVHVLPVGQRKSIRGRLTR